MMGPIVQQFEQLYYKVNNQLIPKCISAFPIIFLSSQTPQKYHCCFQSLNWFSSSITPRIFYKYPWSTSSKSASLAESTSRTPRTSPLRLTGTTISDSELELQAMCPSNSLTLGTMMVWLRFQAAPQTPAPGAMMEHAGGPWKHPSTSLFLWMKQKPTHHQLNSHLSMAMRLARLDSMWLPASMRLYSWASRFSYLSFLSPDSSGRQSSPIDIITYQKLPTLLQQINLYLPMANSPGYIFIQTLYSKHLNCKLCMSLMLQPLRLHPCGHTLCTPCAQPKQIRSCPICTLRIEAKQRDILAGKLIGELMVQCVREGCPWRGSLEEFGNYHQGTCKLREGGIEGWLRGLRDAIGGAQEEAGQGDDQGAGEGGGQRDRQGDRQPTGQGDGHGDEEDKQRAQTKEGREEGQGKPREEKDEDKGKDLNIEKDENKVPAAENAPEASQRASSRKKKPKRKSSNYSPKKTLHADPNI